MNQKLKWSLALLSCLLLSLSISIYVTSDSSSFYRIVIHEGAYLNDQIPANLFIYKNGILIDNVHNVMTVVGEKWVIFQTFNSSYTSNSWAWNVIAIGNGTQTASTATALVKELGRSGALAPGTSGNCMSWTSPNTWELNNTFTGITTVGNGIQESGIFNITTSTHGLCSWYATFSQIGLTSVDTLLICWKGTSSGT
jgi:hypothetical protein